MTGKLRAALHAALQGGPLRPCGRRRKVATCSGNVQYPDALVSDGVEPVAVFDVLPRCTPWIDHAIRRRDYDATPSIRHDVLISQDELCAVVYTRNEGGRLDIRDAQLVEGAESVIALPSLGVTLTLGALHDGLEG
ncbi:MAG: hypothetical protein IT561_11495 [Alphaproteobacteria bacterium]|nr:hypothetical protein [Alphaproteobacteria bacterium]